MEEGIEADVGSFVKVAAIIAWWWNGRVDGEERGRGGKVKLEGAVDSVGTLRYGMHEHCTVRGPKPRYGFLLAELNINYYGLNHSHPLPSPPKLRWRFGFNH